MLFPGEELKEEFRRWGLTDKKDNFSSLGKDACGEGVRPEVGRGLRDRLSPRSEPAELLQRVPLHTHLVHRNAECLYLGGLPDSPT